MERMQLAPARELPNVARRRPLRKHSRTGVRDHLETARGAAM